MTHTPETLPELVDQLQREKAELVAALEWIDTYLANKPLDQQAKFLITEKVKEALAKAKNTWQGDDHW